MNDNIEKMKNFLNPEVFRSNMVSASLYIALFESLRDNIVEEVKEFFTEGIKGGELIISDEYTSKVLSLSSNKRPVYASLLWLKNMEAIDDSDIKIYSKLNSYRNKFAHSLYGQLYNCDFEEFPENFVNLNKLRTKIEKWWIINVEIPTNTNPIEGIVSIEKDDVVTSSEIITKIMFDIAFGSEEEAISYYQEFMKLLEKDISK